MFASAFGFNLTMTTLGGIGSGSSKNKEACRVSCLFGDPLQSLLPIGA